MSTSARPDVECAVTALARTGTRHLPLGDLRLPAPTAEQWAESYDQLGAQLAVDDPERAAQWYRRAHIARHGVPAAAETFDEIWGTI